MPGVWTMIKSKVDEIMAKVIKEWEIKYGKENLDPHKIKSMERILRFSPHNDGLMPCVDVVTGRTHLVPFEDIILHGLKGWELHKYPVKEEE